MGDKQPRIDSYEMGDAKRIVMERIKSRDWWCLIPVDMKGINALMVFENRFFRSYDTAPDYEVAIIQTKHGIGNLAFGLAFARKRSCSSDQIAAFFREYWPHPLPVPGELYDQKDIIVLTKDRTLGRLVGIEFLMWLTEKEPLA